MGKCELRLKETLDAFNITPNQLAVESKIRTASVYDMYKNKTTRIHLSTIAKILDTLNCILQDRGIQEELSVEDIITYTNKKTPFDKGRKK